MKKLAITLSALALTASSYAAVGIVGGQIGDLFTSSNALIPNNSIGIVVADFSNNGVLDPLGTTLTANQFIGGGSDDMILGVYQSSGGNFDFSGLTFSYSGSFGAGDRLYFLWFPTINQLNATVGAGVSYGSFRSDVAQTLSGAEIAWIAPADGNYTLLALTASLGADPSEALDPATLRATLTTAGAAIPEPSSFAAAAGLAMLGFAGMRKRRSV